jgi:CubicO group peptidase (beta-lactamase class C family)
VAGQPTKTHRSRGIAAHNAKRDNCFLLLRAICCASEAIRQGNFQELCRRGCPLERDVYDARNKFLQTSVLAVYRNIGRLSLQRRVHLLSISLILGFIPSLFAQSVRLDKERMLQVVQNYVDNRSFMGAVLVAEGDRIVVSHGSGYADLDWSIPNTVDTRFRIGSLTKQFTAASILLLQERGQLNLNVPIKTYLPDAPSTWDKVTIYHLLTHTSGIPNFTGTAGFDAYKRQNHTPEESVRLVRDKPLDSEPGAKFYYSNSNYILLGEIIERVSGMPYGSFLRQNIFIPVRMTETGVDSDSAILARRAQGYESTPEGFRHSDYINMTIPYSAGFLYSTVADLLKWERALFGGKVVSASSLHTMITANLNEYGMGLFIRNANKHELITHDGSIEGFESSLNYYPERQLTIVVLGNVRTDAPGKIAAQLGKVAFGEKVVLNADRKTVRVDSSVLAGYVGHYSAPPFAITIGVEADQLTATTPNGRKYTLYAQSPTFFFLKEIDVQIEFVRDGASGKITGFTMTQDGNTKNVIRD